MQQACNLMKMGELLVVSESMGRCTTRRLFAIALLLFRLALPDFMALPAAQAAAGDQHETTMMSDKPCPGHQSGSLNDGTCCKTTTCPCLHAPALMSAVPIQRLVIVSYANAPDVLIRHPSGPEPVFFRPPI